MSRAATRHTPRRPLLSVAFVVCGALAREVTAIARRRGWQAEVHAVPADHHVDPRRIPAAVDRMLGELSGRFEVLVVVYGDCGTAGALDRVLARHGAVRPPGPHCYALWGGEEFENLVRQQPETYFLTDYLVRRWKATAARSMSLDSAERYGKASFGGFQRLVFLRQEPRPDLAAKAAAIADELELPLKIRDVGLRHLEARLIELVERIDAEPERVEGSLTLAGNGGSLAR